MSKHRDLAQVVYSNTLGRDSAQRIWRTVVVAGAMLASPMIASAEQQAPPPAKSEKAPAPPANSKPAPPPPPAPTKAEVLKQAQDALKAVEAEVAAHDKTILATTTEVKAAKDQAARDAASAKLKEQQKTKTELKAKVTTAKADVKKADAAVKAEAKANKPKPRPRGDEFEQRPKGRGFILS